MMTFKKDLLQALIEAFIMEKGTKEFYSLASERSVSPAAVTMFKELSDWEEKHMDYILFLYQSIHGDKDIVSFEEFKNNADAPVTEAGITVRDLASRVEKYNIADETGALTLAMEIEGKAYALYRRLSENSEEANARVVFKDMMEQEIKHIDYLKKLKQKLL